MDELHGAGEPAGRRDLVEAPSGRPLERGAAVGRGEVVQDADAEQRTVHGRS